jgi:hypothetical protein
VTYSTELRDAKIHDIRSLVFLAEKLLQTEKEIGGLKIIPDKEVRHKILFDSIGRCLMSPNCKILVIEKSGRITGMFIMRIQDRIGIFQNDKFCDVWLAYSKKSPFFIRKIEANVIQWMKEKGVSLMRITVLTNNERVKQLLNKIGFTEKYCIFEKEV